MKVGMNSNNEIGIYEPLESGDLDGLSHAVEALEQAGEDGTFLSSIVDICQDNPDWGSLLWALSKERIWVNILPSATFSTNTHIAWRWEVRIGHVMDDDISSSIQAMEESRKEGEYMHYAWTKAAREAIRYIVDFYVKSAKSKKNK